MKETSHKSHILYDSIFVKCPETERYISGCQGLGKGGLKGLVAHGY